MASSFAMNMDLCFYSIFGHKVYMKIQEFIMMKLYLPTWEEVEQACPTTLSYKALEEFFIVFRE